MIKRQDLKQQVVTKKHLAISNLQLKVGKLIMADGESVIIIDVKKATYSQ